MSRRGESIYKRKDGRWEARFIHHYENGEAKYRSVYAHSYTEAKAKRFEEISQPECSHVTRVKYIAKFGEISMLWLRDIRSCVKESTYSRYYRIVEHYINPTLADIMLIKLDQQYIKSFSVRLKTFGGMNGSPLSDKTVSDILCVLKSIFRYGNDNGYPCEILTKMKMSAFSKSEPKIITNTKREMIETEIFESESIGNDCRVTIELASRFLDDYITGDQYFRCAYPKHNLVRTRCQLKLAEDIERKWEELEWIVLDVLENI